MPFIPLFTQKIEARGLRVLGQPDQYKLKKEEKGKEMYACMYSCIYIYTHILHLYKKYKWRIMHYLSLLK